MEHTNRTGHKVIVRKMSGYFFFSRRIECIRLEMLKYF